MLRYYQHFGLVRDPFLDTADPQFYCELPVVRRNAARVLAGVTESRGLTVVLGEPGTGKTSLSASVEQSLLRDENVVIGKILDPTFANDVEFLLAIGRVFGLALPPRSSAQLKNALKNFFFDTAVLEDKTLVLLIDEAQNLTPDGLETLRLLLNFQIPQKKLINLILFGQNELDARIVERVNLHDRVDSFVRLEPFDAAASIALIEHRLVRAGKLPTLRIFTSDALDTAVAAAGGLPRRIANVARSAMIEAADRSAEIVGIDHVVSALRGRGIAVPPPPPVAAPPPNVILTVRSEPDEAMAAASSVVAAAAAAKALAPPPEPLPPVRDHVGNSFLRRLFARRT